MTTNRILVAGCGSIGQRHIRNLRSLGEVNITAYDPDPDLLRHVVDTYQVQTCSDLNTGFAQSPTLALICTPPHLHAQILTLAIENGANAFVEKPIASKLDGLEESLARAAKRGLIVAVGYNLRFHPGIRKLKDLIDHGSIGKPLIIRAEFGQYLPDWRPQQDYTSGYNVSAEMGGGILLDASHEIDYVRWLAGEVESVYCLSGHLSSLKMNTEDAAAIILRITGGAIAEVHLDCVQRGYSRNCKIIGEEGTLTWDFNEGVRLLTASDKAWQFYPTAVDSNDMYVQEMQHVLGCVSGAEEPVVNGETGLRVLRIVLAAKESAQRCQEVRL